MSTWIKALTPRQVNSVVNIYHGQWMPEMDRCWIRKEDGTMVCSRMIRTKWGNIEHVTITKQSEGKLTTDGSNSFSWAEKQQIKDELFGTNRVAIEVFPKSDKLVDVMDVYHLWVFDKKFEMPFGIHPKEYQKAINRGSMPLTDSELSELKEYYKSKDRN